MHIGWLVFLELLQGKYYIFKQYRLYTKQRSILDSDLYLQAAEEGRNAGK
jgi:hypothetical protein